MDDEGPRRGSRQIRVPDQPLAERRLRLRPPHPRAVRRNEPADAFARADSLTSAGSNFRVPEVNFFRALADRTPRGIAAAVARPFLGTDFSALPPGDQTNLAAFFAGGHLRPHQGVEGGNRLLEALRRDRHPDAPRRFPPPRRGRDRPPRALRGLPAFRRLPRLRPVDGEPRLVRALRRGSTRTRTTSSPPAATPSSPSCWRGTSLPPATTSGRSAAKSRRPSRESAFVPAGDYEKARRAFAVYPIRRLDAEVLQDAIRDLTTATFEYSSVIPKPSPSSPRRTGP